MADSAKLPSSGPDFVCIGLPKAGTTWLYRNLHLHPQVNLLRVKEFNYLGAEAYRPHPHSLRQLFFSDHWTNFKLRTYLKRRSRFYARHLFEIGKYRRDLAWDLRFLFAGRDDAWYCSLFPQEGVTGDISPVYASMGDEQVAPVRALLPHLKVILLLRDPIQRAWSHTKMRLQRKTNPNLSAISRAAFERSLTQEFRDRGEYMSLVDRWVRHFGPSQVYVGFYDELEEDCIAHFQRVCRFLEIDVTNLPPKLLGSLSRKVIPTPALQIPGEMARFLAEAYRPHIVELCTRFQPYPQRWLEACDRMLAGQASAPPDGVAS